MFCKIKHVYLVKICGKKWMFLFAKLAKLKLISCSKITDRVQGRSELSGMG